MSADAAELPMIADELELLAALVPLAGRDIVELGCGAAALARRLLLRHPDSRVTAVEIDARQHAKNLAQPQPGLHFISGVAQAIALPDAGFDLALMLKSLHHVPLPAMAQALNEINRVLRPGGHLYVSEPVFAGPFNEVMRLFNDEQAVRAAAQAALDDALRRGVFTQRAERRFGTPVTFSDFADFERRMMQPSFADHAIDAATRAAVRSRFESFAGAAGVPFSRPMHVRLLQRRR